MYQLTRLCRSVLASLTAVIVLAVTVVGTVGMPAHASGVPTPHTVKKSAVRYPSGAIVVDWNAALLKILGTPGAQPATIHPTRSLAVLQAAIYDAVVSITHRGSPYLFSITAPTGARADAAAAQAGHDTLAALYPSWKATLDGQLAAELAAIPAGAATQQGIEVGQMAAAFALAARSNDGSSLAPTPFLGDTQPGDYRPTPSFVAPGVFTQWSGVTPFVLKTASQFRPSPPPALSSAAWAQALNEVKSLGQSTSTTRTADQTVIAKFWPGPIWTTWNEIAEKSALAHHTDLVRTARLFALLNLSFADTTIAMYDAKYQYHLWRPVTAIRSADTAGNPAVTPDASWSPLLTASDPSYPGAHSAISSAGATVLTSFFGKHDRIKVTSDVLPGVVRTFGSYTAAATEAGLSRIYGGVHTRLDHDAGLKLGKDVASYVLGQARTSRFGLR